MNFSRVPYSWACCEDVFALGDLAILKLELEAVAAGWVFARGKAPDAAKAAAVQKLEVETLDSSGEQPFEFLDRFVDPELIAPEGDWSWNSILLAPDGTVLEEYDEALDLLVVVPTVDPCLFLVAADAFSDVRHAFPISQHELAPEAVDGILHNAVGEHYVSLEMLVAHRIEPGQTRTAGDAAEKTSVFTQLSLVGRLFQSRSIGSEPAPICLVAGERSCERLEFIELVASPNNIVVDHESAAAIGRIFDFERFDVPAVTTGVFVLDDIETGIEAIAAMPHHLGLLGNWPLKVPEELEGGDYLLLVFGAAGEFHQLAVFRIAFAGCVDARPRFHLSLLIM